MRKNYRVGITEFQGIEGAYLVISGRWKNDEHDYCTPMVSFLFDGGDFAAEWEPQHGPIQIWEKCTAEHPKCEKHYFYDYVVKVFGNWSQLAVSNNGLPSSFVDGNYEHIYSVLKQWTEGREHEPVEDAE